MNWHWVWFSICLGMAGLGTVCFVNGILNGDTSAFYFLLPSLAFGFAAGWNWGAATDKMRH